VLFREIGPVTVKSVPFRLKVRVVLPILAVTVGYVVPPSLTVKASFATSAILPPVKVAPL